MSIGALFLVFCVTTCVSATAQTWTLVNPTDETYVDEPVRLNLDLPDWAAVGEFRVARDGRQVGYQVEEIGGRPWVWVAATLQPGESARYALGKGTPAKSKPLVTVRREDDAYLMDNGPYAVKVPAVANGLPGPIHSVRLPGGKWVGRSFWRTGRKLKHFSATVVGDGTVFGKVRLRYEFEGLSGVWGDTPAFAQVDVTLNAKHRHAIIEESHEMDVEDYWEFEATDGWNAREALCQIHSGGAGRPIDRNMWPKDLEPLGFDADALERRYRDADPRVGDTLMWLLPRWSQAYEDGWFFAASDAQHCVGAMVARAGKWLWPHDNRIEIKARPSADYAGLRCPTWRGRRYWMLVVHRSETLAERVEVIPPSKPGQKPKEILHIPAGDYAYRYAFRPLEKIVREYITTWPGKDDGKVAYPRSINPLKIKRGWLGGSHGGFSAETPLQRLVACQVMLDPDMYGRYRLFWSPENPNFYTDFMKVPLGMLGEFRSHPRYRELEAMAKEVRDEDANYSVTQPGGAGQECPGYHAYAKGIGSFHRKTSQPLGDGRRGMHPGGDTHPPYVFGDKVGSAADVKGLKTEEFPGFGVVFHNRPGTERETYLALKSGPNRGHFHGDQLAFHYCANGFPLAVDHHCSYSPRAGQEHMHNRVAFSTPELPYANMDGYERLIALKTSRVADVAIGQVESGRLRYVKPFPPEDWDREWPQVKLDPPLVYRRAVVLMRDGSGGQDYFVIRDQFAGPELTAHYCLHVLGEHCRQQGNFVDFEGMTLFVAKPEQFKFGRHDWAHANGRLERTCGARLSVDGATGELITVLYPRPVKRVDQLRLTLAAAVYLPKLDKRTGKTEKQPRDVVVTLDYDGDRLFSRAVVEVPDFNRAMHTGTVEAHTVEARGDEIRLTLNLGSDRRAEGGDGKFDLQLRRRGSEVAGTYSGAYRGEKRTGEIAGELKKAVLSGQGHWDHTVEPPAMEAIPDGVQIGDDRITFAGGIDENDATTYVRIERAGTSLLSLGGADVNPDRFQGEIGLFVPDTGYPFGRIPDWLIRQRVPRPDAGQ